MSSPSSRPLCLYALYLRVYTNEYTTVPLWKYWGKLFNARAELKTLALVEGADVVSITDLIKQYDVALSKKNQGLSSMGHCWKNSG